MSKKESQLEIGKSYICNNSSEFGNPDYYEITVLDISPSGELVKVEYLTKLVKWIDLEELKLVEEL